MHIWGTRGRWVCTGRRPGQKLWHMMTPWYGNVFCIGCVGPLWRNSPVIGEYSSHRPVKWSFYVFFDTLLFTFIVTSTFTFLAQNLSSSSPTEINTSCWFHGNLTRDEDITRAISGCQNMLHIEFNAVIEGGPHNAYTCKNEYKSYTWYMYRHALL